MFDNVNKVCKIQKRLTIILMNLPNRKIKRVLKEKAVPREKIDDLIAHTSHTVSVNSNRVTCTVCHNSFRISDPACRHWLSTACVPCIADSPHSEHQVINITTPIHIGNQLTHSSHRLRTYSYRGLLYIYIYIALSVV